jgi:protein O-GlcNAc transferase
MGKPLETIFMNAKRHVKQGDFDAAKKLYEGVLLQFPKNVRARQGIEQITQSKLRSVAMDGAPPVHDTNQFLSLYHVGRLDEAVSKGEALLRDFPRSILLHDVLGQIYLSRGQREKAAVSFRSGVDIRPDRAEAHYNLAVVLQELEQYDAAVAAYENAIANDPVYVFAYNNLGALHNVMGNPKEAIMHLQSAIKLKPDYADAYNNLGNAFRDLGNKDTAVAYYNQTIQLQPDHAKAHRNLGIIKHSQGKKGEAILCLERALHYAPESGDVHREMADILLEFNLREEAIASLDRALAIDPEDLLAHAVKLTQWAHMCDWDGLRSYEQRIPELGIGSTSAATWRMLAFEDAPARHRLRSERAVSARIRKAERFSFTPPQTRPDKLRIGYFSSDIAHHATMFLLARMVELHDRDRFEVHAFSYGEGDSSAYRPLFDRFTDVRSMKDEDIAALARKGGLDIAIDLKGHTKDARLGIFAHGAAPVQISYLGYPGTSGAPFIDYMIADKVVVPDEQREHYSESMIYLPGSYQVNDNRRAISDRPMTRADMGLPEDAFVFACFNNNYKITPEEYDIWMRLLSKVEGSVLWLFKANPWAEDNLRKEAEKRGVDSARIIFAAPMHVTEHLARQHLADLFLDTFNVNAHTTASDALWGGLPVLTRMGKGFAARVAGSLLHAVGLPELAVSTSQDYEAKALELATQPEKLAELKARLAANQFTAPLFDTEAFVEHIEAGYIAAYDRYFNAMTPDDIAVG